MPKHYDTRIKHRRAMNVSRPSKSPPTKHTVETQSFFVYEECVGFGRNDPSPITNPCRLRLCLDIALPAEKMTLA